MAKQIRGNGLAVTNDILQAILRELGAIKGRLGELDAIKGELGAVKGELAGIKAEVIQHGQILREHGEILRDHGVRLHGIETAMRQVASFVGEERLIQKEEMQSLNRRVEALERKVA